jgi:molybdenum cofactor cytidylyltransferase
VRNPDFAAGLSTSLKCGLAALGDEIEGALICLADMPLIAGRDLDRLIAAFNPVEGRAIVVPTRRGRRGNPVLWARRFFPEMMALSGDAGARRLIDEYAELVAEIEMDSDAVLVDIDTPEALAELRGRTKPNAA